MRVIFDTIVRALYGTDYHETVKSLFRGITTRYKTCLACGESTERPEEFFDLCLQVKNIKSVGQSLQAMTAPESMDGDNAIYCDTCQSKQDMLLGARLQELPGALVLSLNRFDFDYEKMDRVKLNDFFEFQL
jgi:ubiquitin carboxyl-terminal hydrolase 40